MIFAPTAARDVALDVRTFGAAATGGDDQPAINAAILAAASRGIRYVTLSPGSGGTATYNLGAYSTDGSLNYHLLMRSGVVLHVPAGVTLRTSVAAARIFSLGLGADSWSGVAVTPMTGTYARGGYSITLATASDAAGYAAGDWILIRTGQTLTTGTDNPIGEYNIVDAADAGTGVITLKLPLKNDYQQEQYPTGHALAGTNAPYGIVKVALLKNSGIIGGGTIENVAASATAPLIYGNQVVGFSWGGDAGEPMTLQSTGGIMSLGMSFSEWKHLRIYPGSADFYGVSQDKCNHGWSMNDVLIDAGSNVCYAHFHEGCSGTATDLTVKGNDGTAGYNLVSVRARTHDITFTNLVTNGQGETGVNPNIYVDSQCERIDFVNASDTNPNASQTSVYVDGSNCDFEGTSTNTIYVAPGKGNTLNGAAV